MLSMLLREKKSGQIGSIYYGIMEGSWDGLSKDGGLKFFMCSRDNQFRTMFALPNSFYWHCWPMRLSTMS